MRRIKTPTTFILILICFCCLIPPTLSIIHKTQLHVDEVWTYGLSNSTSGPYLYVWRTGIGDDSVSTRYSDEETSLEDTEGKFFRQWHTGTEFRDYITVQPDERFDYSTVYYNQSCDVHPPLYYFIIHTICSLFPNAFSVWYAYIPNLVFMVFSILLLFHIAMRLGLGRRAAFLIPLFWGLSRAGISDAVFLRMYMMLTCITLLSAYLHIRLYEKQDVKITMLIFLVNLAGFLTQYYYYIFCFFLTAVFCVYFIVRRKIKFAAAYGTLVLASVGLAILLFPAIKNQILNGAYTESTSIKVDSFRRITDWASILWKDMIGQVGDRYALIYTSVAFVIILLLAVSFAVRLRKDGIRANQVKNWLKGFYRRRAMPYWLLLLTVILTGCLLGLVSPRMPYYQDRYYFNILPLLAIYIVDFVITVTARLLSSARCMKLRRPAIVICLILFVLCSNVFTRNNYIDYDNNSTSLTESLKGETCFLVMDQDLRVHVYPVYLQYADRVYVSHGVDDLLLTEMNSNSDDHAFVIVQFGWNSAQSIKELMDGVRYKVSELDHNIETTLGYKENDALLLVDYSDPVQK